MTFFFGILIGPMATLTKVHSAPVASELRGPLAQSGATGSSGNGNAQLSDPLSGVGVQGILGYYANWVTKKPGTYYNVSYNNSTILSGGSAPTLTNIGDDPITFGDQPFEVDAQAGGAKASGTLLNSWNAIPLNVLNGVLGSISLPKELKAVLGYNGQISQQQQGGIVYAIEYQFPFGNTGTSNKGASDNSGNTTTTSNTDTEKFIALGFSNENHSASQSTGTAGGPTTQSHSSQASFFFRGRVGVGYGFSVSTDQATKATQDKGKPQSAALQPLLANRTVTSVRTPESLEINDIAAVAGALMGKPDDAAAATKRAAIQLQKFDAKYHPVLNSDDVSAAAGELLASPAKGQFQTLDVKAAFSRPERVLATKFTQNVLSKLDTQTRSDTESAVQTLMTAGSYRELASAAEQITRNMARPEIQSARSDATFLQSLGAFNATVLGNTLFRAQSLAGAMGDRDSIKSKISPNQNRWGLYGEFDGEQALESNTIDGTPKTRFYYTINGRYNFTPSNPDTVYLVATFENGFTRAEPNQRVSLLNVSLNFKFTTP